MMNICFIKSKIYEDRVYFVIYYLFYKIYVINIEDRVLEIENI